MNARDCICRNKPVERLLGAYTARAKRDVAAGVVDGRPPPSYRDLKFTVTLIRALAEGREQGPFQDRHRHLDHHLRECPCSPYYRAPGETP